MGIVSSCIDLRGKVRRSISHRGLAGTLRYVPEYLAYSVKQLKSRRRRNGLAEASSETLFDLQFNVDTAGIVKLPTIAVLGSNRDHGHYYHGTDEKAFTQLMRQLPIEFNSFVFIDYGSGKGKALLLASLWNFASIIGVEFGKVLHDAALRNLGNFRHPQRQCGDVKSVHMDATEFELPDVPLVLYFYNPFSEHVMAAVLKKVEESWRRHPREIWLCYYHLYAHAPLDKVSFLNLVQSAPDYRIYRSLPPRP